MRQRKPQFNQSITIRTPEDSDIARFIENLPHGDFSALVRKLIREHIAKAKRQAEKEAVQSLKEGK